MRTTFRKGRLILLFFALIFCMSAWHSIPARAADKDEEIQKVHSIYWKAKLNTSVKVKIDGKKTTLKAGKYVVVTRRARGVSTVTYKNVKFNISTSKLTFVSDLCTSVTEGDYNEATKLWFVNTKHKLSSQTKYLVWVSLDKQRVNVYTGKKGSWKLLKVMKCSTGRAAAPTSISFSRRIGWRKQYYNYCWYYVEYAGSGFHKWPGGGMSKTIGKHTASSGCVRLSKKNAIWFYNNIPQYTRCVFY